MMTATEKQTALIFLTAATNARQGLQQALIIAVEVLSCSAAQAAAATHGALLHLAVFGAMIPAGLREKTMNAY